MCLEQIKVTWNWLNKNDQCCRRGPKLHIKDWNDGIIDKQEVRDSFCLRYISQEIAEIGATTVEPAGARFLPMHALLKSQLMAQNRLLPLTNLIVTETKIIRPEPQLSDIQCKLEADIPRDTLKKLNKQTNRARSMTRVMTMNSPYSAGLVQVMRKVEPVERDGTMMLEIHIGNTTKFDQTLILTEGTVVGCAFSANEPGDQGSWVFSDDMIMFRSPHLDLGFLHFEYRKQRGELGMNDQFDRRSARTKEERQEWIRNIDKGLPYQATPGGLMIGFPQKTCGLKISD